MQQQQLHRNCSRCQSFHRHHHRQRRRSSTLHEDFICMSATTTTNDNDCALGNVNVGNVSANAKSKAVNMLSKSNSTTNGNSKNSGHHTTKAIINFTTPVAAASLNVGPASSMSGSLLTIASVPTSLKFNTASTPSGRNSLSADTTPLNSVNTTTAHITKHCSFALAPHIIPPLPPPRQLSFLTPANRFKTQTSSCKVVATTTTTTTVTTFRAAAHTCPTLTPPVTASAPSLIEATDDLAVMPLTPLAASLTPSLHSDPDQYSSCKQVLVETRESALNHFTTFDDLERSTHDKHQSELQERL